MDMRSILKAVEELDHNQRMKYMVNLGKKAQSNRKLANSLAALARSETHYERLLALTSAWGSHDHDLIAAFLADASSSLGLAAIKLAAQYLPEANLVAVISGMTRRRCYALAKALARVKRGSVNVLAYETLEPEAQRWILPLTTREFIQSNLDPEQIVRWTETQWGQMAYRFPDMACDLLLADVDRAGGSSLRIQLAVQAALFQMLRIAPRIGMRLLKGVQDKIPAYFLALNRYAVQFPEEIADIVQQSAGRVKVAWSPAALRKLDIAQLLALADKKALPENACLFSQLRPEQRIALYESSGENWRDSSGALLLDVVKTLPAAVRHREARHAFSSPLLASLPEKRIFYLACLPFEEAQALAKPFLSQPDVTLRGQALRAVVGTGRYQPTCLDPILDLCLARKNEADPVRLSMLDGLAKLPPSRFAAQHLPKIKGIIAAALAARDCSAQTMATAARLLLGLTIAQTHFVAEELPSLVERMGGLHAVSLESRLSDREMVALAPKLIPLLETWIIRERSHFALGLIFNFGRRAKSVPEFARLMTELTSDKRAHVARSGLEGLLRADFRIETALLIPQLIKQDPGWIMVNTVAHHLHKHRQSLLTPFLSARSYKGRFGTGKAAGLPAFDAGFWRWTATQQATYAKAQVGILTTRNRNAWELMRAVGRLGAMPSIDVTPLVELARLDATDVALRDWALTALGQADAGRGVAPLINALDDDRGRVAIYALRRSLTAMPATAVFPILERAPLGKVTVAKEVLRIAGEFHGAEAHAFLSCVSARDDLHEDVRIALLRALWNHLDQEEVWALFHSASESDRAAVARATIRIPQNGLSVQNLKRLSAHLTRLLRHPDAQIRRETLQRLIDAPLGDGEMPLREALLSQINETDPEVAVLAVRGLLKACLGRDDSWLASTLSATKNAQALAAIVAAYGGEKRCGQIGLEPSAAALATGLLERHWHPGLAFHLVGSILPPLDALAFLQRFESAGLLHPGAVQDALAVLADMCTAQTIGQLRDVETILRAEPSQALRRIGLELLCESTRLHGWYDAERVALQHYRADQSPWISDAADLIEPPAALQVVSGI